MITNVLQFSYYHSYFTDIVSQPMDQSVIKCLKSAYFRRSASKTIDISSTKELKEFWDKFTVKDVAEQLIESWKEVKSTTVAKSWHKIFPEWCREEPTAELDETTRWEKSVENSNAPYARYIKEPFC